MLARHVGESTFRLHRIREPRQMLDERRVICTLALGFVDLGNDSRNCFCGRLQCIDTGLLKTDVVIVHPAHEAIQRPGNRDPALDIGHVRTAVQGVTCTIQLVCDGIGRLVIFAGFEVIDDDLEMPGSLLGENVQQHRVHFERWLIFFLDGGRLAIDGKNGRIGIAFRKRLCSSHQQADVALRFGANLELLDQLRHRGRGFENKLDHRWRPHERAIDEAVEQVLDRPAILADSLGADHAATAFECME